MIRTLGQFLSDPGGHSHREDGRHQSRPCEAAAVPDDWNLHETFLSNFSGLLCQKVSVTNL